MKSSITRWFLSVTHEIGLKHASRTAIAAIISLAIPELLKMHEAYWAPISTIIVMQSTLGASWSVSKQRLIGTILGATIGGILTIYLEPTIVTFGIAIFILGIICSLFHLDQSAYRFSGVTLAIIMLVSEKEAAWLIGLHRFAEVSLGIMVALLLTAVWPEHKPKVI